MYIYSAKNNSFYTTDLKDAYESAGSWPDDGVDVDEATFKAFTSTPPDGKVRGSNSDGSPAWVDIPPLTHEQLVSAAEADKQKRIDSANAYMNSKQWPGKAAMGRLSDAEKAQYNLWLDYLDELETVDTSTAPDIKWPTPPAA
ncbi:tail fiber assembly protein [Enterobacter hormaechei]|jgi:hypothetical protein|nr:MULTISPECIES: tail fiber assembly protein [Enterobacter cloacae complex]CAE7795354.1 Prophage tail fiber assembly protein TfaE [Enterobacter cloacae]MDU2340576.1 tail fiber assembly protein [Enterobacter asburiae]MDU4296033.1 tail fiber assembly protein [Enterobacter asburiae]TWX76600.1 tail fiber assembly protein [Enterobacter hormaechei]UWA77247.1 tail fiber assembly protein [Enterobacter asburiae]